jgi:hypothetical protein
MLVFVAMVVFLLTACTAEDQENEIHIERESANRVVAIPQDAVKLSPMEDRHPPILHSEEFYEPVPLEGPINTAGAEDSPFISPNGELFFFFFTPDVSVPVEEQLLDGVTGIYLSRRVGDEWGDPERVVLQESGKLALDGCGFFDGQTLWFCSAREGYTGLHWFASRRENGGWSEPDLVDFDPDYEVGELHIHDDKLYFHSTRPGGKGEMDLWVSQIVGGVRQPPVNLEALNSEVSDGYPFITADGQELWFTRWYEGTPAVYRSIRSGGEWAEPELVISRFAGEPTLDPQGNLYFVHHFYQDGEMIEADIFVAIKK